LSSSPTSWVSSLSHHFLPHWWANCKKFHSLEVRFGTRESAVPENDLSVGWLWAFCPNLLPLWRKSCLLLLFSATILRRMPLSHTDLFIFREIIFPTVWKIPTAIRTVWKSIIIQHSLPTLQMLSNAASRFTCSSLIWACLQQKTVYPFVLFIGLHVLGVRFWNRTAFLVARYSRNFVFPYILYFVMVGGSVGGWVDGWMDGWMDGWTKTHTWFFFASMFSTKKHDTIIHFLLSFYICLSLSHLFFFFHKIPPVSTAVISVTSVSLLLSVCDTLIILLLFIWLSVLCTWHM
jgi:hypothetical protein